MEDKNREVQIGAGLQESRINTDLIDWLQKWGPRALYVVLAIVLVYLGLDRWERWQLRNVDQAFADYQAQRDVGDPDGLLDIAAEHEGQREVWSLATLDAANILLYSARNGLRPGADPMNPQESDVLSFEEREAIAARAAELFEEVRAHVGTDPDKARFVLRATWGLATAALNEGDFQSARAHLLEVKRVAEEHAFAIDATLAERRIELVDELAADPIAVYAEADLPESAIEPKPVQPQPPTQIQQVPQGIQPLDGGVPSRISGPQPPPPGDADAESNGEGDGGDAPGPEADQPDPE